MRRFCAILLIIFQTVFLNIVVPGHLRGVVTVSGKSSVKGLGDLVCGGCCSKRTESKTHRDGEQGKPTPKDRKECAICFVAATLSNPVAIDLTFLQLGQVDFVILPAPQV